MKKLIVPMLALSVFAASAFGQGLVTITAGLSAATRMSTNSVPGGPATGLTTTTGSSFYYALFASANQTTINGSSTAVSGLSGNYVFNNLGSGVASGGWVLVGIGTNTLNAGRVSNMSQGTNSAGQNALNADGSMTVTGVGGGNVGDLVIVGWAGAGIGSTLASLEAWYAAGANNGWIGQSAIASGTFGDGGLNGTFDPFGTGAGQVSGILIGSTVPEPGTLALAAIGGASLLLFRRKK